MVGYRNRGIEYRSLTERIFQEIVVIFYPFCQYGTYPEEIWQCNDPVLVDIQIRIFDIMIIIEKRLSDMV